MAKYDYDIGALQKALEELSNIDEVAPRMLKSAAPIVTDSIKEVLKQRPHRITGGLIASVKPGKPKEAKNHGWYLMVGFRGKGVSISGYDENNHPNAVKAAGLEYGNSHQQPRPFLDAAARACEEAVTDAMQANFNLWLAEKELAGR